MKKPISTPGPVRRVGNDPLKPTLAAGVPGVVAPEPGSRDLLAKSIKTCKSPAGLGRFHTDRPCSNAFTDSAPDRWGQTLIRRNELRRASAEGRQPMMGRPSPG